MAVIIGTSGWLYKDWNGIFYPDDVKAKDRFTYYTTQFDSVEVNSTFYHMPRAATAKNWRDSSPEDFRFAIKLNRYLTHTKRLNPDQDFNDSLRYFYDQIRPLGHKLAVILVQVSPAMKADNERLGRLAERTAKYAEENKLPLRLALEFRHESWFTDDTYKIMNRHNLANVINDSPDRWPASKAVTADFVYIRFHGSRRLYRSSYTHKELRNWAKFIRQDCRTCRDVFAYFNNDYEAVAVDNARMLIQKLASFNGNP